MEIEGSEEQIRRWPFAKELVDDLVQIAAGTMDESYHTEVWDRIPTELSVDEADYLASQVDRYIERRAPSRGFKRGKQYEREALTWLGQQSLVRGDETTAHSVIEVLHSKVSFKSKFGAFILKHELKKKGLQSNREAI